MAAQGMVGLLPTDDIDVTSGETAAAKHMREDFQFRVYVHLPVPMMAFAISAKNNSLQEVNAKMCFVSKLEMTLKVPLTLCESVYFHKRFTKIRLTEHDTNNVDHISYRHARPSPARIKVNLLRCSPTLNLEPSLVLRKVEEAKKKKGTEERSHRT